MSNRQIAVAWKKQFPSLGRFMPARRPNNPARKNAKQRRECRRMDRASARDLAFSHI